MPEVNFHNEMIVNDRGICQRLYIDDKTFGDKIVITKEAFIEAYNRYIKEDNNEEFDEMRNNLVCVTKRKVIHNEELRMYAAGKGVKLWQVAARFGITDAAFSRKMRKPFTDDEASRFRSYVDEIASDSN